ncbi:MAG: helix-turn-helix domain-containing protein [Desulfurococcales archaeon]|nr:helix-turn-helix domain-containing protein [Desulfurococcales archaeon]
MSRIEMVRRILAEADRIAGEHELLSHRVRVLILAAVSALGEASWTDIKTVLEKLLGPVNPNTLAFHIRKLVGEGVLERIGSHESPIYKLAKRPSKEIIELAKEIKNLASKQDGG